ncbi:MAG: ImmA/IrrE family metallo-endopeptidase [Candidatus Gracilibacteria bacterium]|nr:ImmA/IrrE family metallo-endopeptidase [Candidatus Gracilibacteria bacterium]MDD2908745.1 ImmA/IrrE family metallo-endopeptidase [Candidatus Gracilibacteria bacterium]
MTKMPESLKIAKITALNLLQIYNITEAPINISKILKGEGLNIYEFHFPDEFDNIAGMLDLEQKTILINENNDDYDKSFIAARELGHWILHKKFINECPEKYLFVFKKDFDIKDKDFLKKEADDFALNLLVPRFILDRYKDNFSIVELSKIFGTSQRIIEERLTGEYFNQYVLCEEKT